MNKSVREEPFSAEIDPGLFAVCGIAGFYRIGADPDRLKRELALFDRRSEPLDLVRAARFLA
jgi:ATP-binding cassette, subfamily B, bacterial HlyB/CyaB